MLHWLFELYKRELFQPGIIGFFFNPFFIIRRALHQGIKLHAPTLTGKLMDFGCGRKPYRNLFSVAEYIGVDVEESGHEKTNMQVDVYYDGKILPFPDQTFDSVFSAEVFEHIFDLEPVLDELNRVSKPGAHLLITVPFVWEEHEVPYDFGRYSSYGLTYLLEKHGFEILSFTKSTTTVETIFQVWNSYVYIHILRIRPVQLLLTPVLISPIAAIGILLAWLLPRSRNLFHNSIVLARKKS